MTNPGLTESNWLKLCIGLLRFLLAQLAATIVRSDSVAPDQTHCARKSVSPSQPDLSQTMDRPDTCSTLEVLTA